MISQPTAHYAFVITAMTRKHFLLIFMEPELEIVIQQKLKSNQVINRSDN